MTCMRWLFVACCIINLSEEKTVYLHHVIFVFAVFLRHSPNVINVSNKVGVLKLFSLAVDQIHWYVKMDFV